MWGRGDVTWQKAYEERNIVLTRRLPACDSDAVPLKGTTCWRQGLPLVMVSCRKLVSQLV